MTMTGHDKREMNPLLGAGGTLAGLWMLGLGRADDFEVYGALEPDDVLREWWARHKERAQRRDIRSAANLRARLARARDELAELLESDLQLHLVPRPQLGKAASGIKSSFALIRGELSDAPALALVGTRELCAEDAPRVERWIAELLCGLHVRVVSGGALGVDALAHRVALELGLATDVIFAGGLQHVGPRANDALFMQALEQRGSWWTLRPPGYRPFRPDFLARNAVIAARSEAVVVVRAPHRSGALNTAAHARELGVPVLAVPCAPDDDAGAGCLGLLRSGAAVATCARDIALACPQIEQGALFSEEELSGGFAERRSLSAGQLLVCEALFDGVRHIDALIASPLLSEIDVFLELLELEMQGIVRAAEGGRYALTSQGRRRIAAAARPSFGHSANEPER